MAGKSVFLSVISLERFVIDGYRGTRTHVVDVGDEAARLQHGAAARLRLCGGVSAPRSDTSVTCSGMAQMLCPGINN